MGMNAKEMINRLEQYSPTKQVEFDFGGYVDYIDSWRGSYSQPALYWTINYNKFLVKDLITMLEDVDGMKVTGYKGGDYVLNDDDTIWVTPTPNISGTTTIDRISEEEYSVVLHTRYEEY